MQLHFQKDASNAILMQINGIHINKPKAHGHLKTFYTDRGTLHVACDLAISSHYKKVI